jgi:hypothetical protein
MFDPAEHDRPGLKGQDPYKTYRAADLATVLAALRFYQEHGQGDPEARSPRIHHIATDHGRVISLNANGIDALCERLNVEGWDH